VKLITAGAWLALVVASAACCPEARSVRGAVPSKSACTAGSKAPASVGVDVRPGRRHSDARTVSITNVGDTPRSIRVTDVSRLEGPCSGEWARSTALVFADAATSESPGATTLRPGEHVEVTVGQQMVSMAAHGRSSATWECAKIGLALWMAVDGERVCSDAGAWIAAGDQSEGD
jgi:hypothetical protein